MKYIKTKHEIWQLDDLGCVHHPYNGMPIHKSYLEIIKEADTIEELCDRYIVVYGKFYTVYKKKAFNRTNHRLLCLDIRDDKKECYGAVWTEWGLKYVAKMNEKGELELL